MSNSEGMNEDWITMLSMFSLLLSYVVAFDRVVINMRLGLSCGFFGGLFVVIFLIYSVIRHVCLRY